MAAESEDRFAAYVEVSRQSWGMPIGQDRSKIIASVC